MGAAKETTVEYLSTRNGSTLALGFQGKLTFLDQPVIQSLLEDIEKDDFKKCIVDVASLDTIDSAGLGMLLIISDAIGDLGKEFELHAPKGQVAKMLEISNFAEMMPIKP